MAGPKAPGAPGTARRLARTASVLALGLVVLAMALLSLPQVLGYGTVIVRSGSMAAIAPVGSLVVARPLEPAEVRVGDVILVRVHAAQGPAGPPVMHRVLELTRRGGELVVTTKGDSNPRPDPTPYVLSGRTMTPVLVVPRLGFAVAYTQTPAGWVMLIGLPGTLLLLLQLRAIWRPSRQVTESAALPVRPGHAPA